MKEAKIWGTRGLKQTYRKEFDHAKGDYVKIPNPKRVTATVEYDCDVAEAGQYEDQKVYLLTEQEFLAGTFKATGSIELVIEKQDEILAKQMELGKLIDTVRNES